MKNTLSLIGRWRAYYKQVSSRIHFDRGFVRGAIMVIRIYLHYAFKNLTGLYQSEKTSSQRTLAFYPNPVGPWYTIWMALQSTKLKIVSFKKLADIVFIFDDKTEVESEYELTGATHLLVNSKVTDISKGHVAKVFENVFKYPLSVDPLSYEGEAVCKSDENGTHDGHLITLPITPDKVKASNVYQILVDSTFDGIHSEDLRIAYVYGSVPVVFHKIKALNQRFGTTYLSTTLRNAEDVFTPIELTNIKEFCDQIGLEFGALDVMRDKVTNKIYIVDVNKTCMPVLSLPKADLIDAVERIGHAFETSVEARLSPVS